MSPHPTIEKQELSHYDNVAEGAPISEALVRPAREFSPEEEKKLYRKIDMRILPILSFLYLLSFMDRGNIGNARLAGLETDLNMTGTDYSVALSVYFISYGLFEVPANLALKKLTPRTWLSFITVVWGIVMVCMGLVNNWAGLVATRVALGIAEAGLYPGVVFYLSLWYPRYKFQTRLSLFFASATIAGSFSGLLAYAIGFMGGIGGYNGWRWIFILEGLLTVVAGFGAYFAIVDYPETAKFMTEDEIAWVTYVRAIDQGQYGEADQLTFKFIRDALSDWQIIFGLMNYWSIDVGLYSVALFMPTIINSFGQFTRPVVQLLTIPVYAVACAWVIICGILADRQRKRGVYMMINLILLGIGFIIQITDAPIGVKYFGLFFAASGAYGALPNVVSWLSNNLAGQTKRGVGVATQIGVGNFIAIVSSNIYTTTSAPRYILGHGVNLGFVALGLISVPTYAFLLSRANKKRAAIRALPEAEQPKYTPEETRALGDKHFNFKYMI